MMNTHNDGFSGLARLALADGSVFRGDAFGAVGRGISQAAEIVFNTAMSGYQEAITDPSYSGQVLVFTAPLIGNTGVNEEDVESVRVQVAGVVVRELARVHSNYRASMSLSDYLAKEGVLGISGVDTRALTMRLRVGGATGGIITDVAESEVSDGALVEMARKAPSMAGQNLVPRVGCASDFTWKETLGAWSPRANDARDERSLSERSLGASGKRRVLALDCGAKRNILRNLADRGCVIDVVPHTISAQEVRQRFERGEADGLFVSNGPGDPAAVEQTVAMLSEVVGGGRGASAIPTFGICLGHQLLALAVGAKTYKLKFGHRGLNQPVLNLITSGVEITSQNHGFAVDAESLERATGGAAQATHINLNDQTLAGFLLRDRPLFAVQHHPEASPGPHDASYLFDAFVQMMRDRKPMSLEGFRAVEGRARGAVGV